MENTNHKERKWETLECKLRHQNTEKINAKMIDDVSGEKMNGKPVRRKKGFGFLET